MYLGKTNTNTNTDVHSASCFGCWCVTHGLVGSRSVISPSRHLHNSPPAREKTPRAGELWQVSTIGKGITPDSRLQPQLQTGIRHNSLFSLPETPELAGACCAIRLRQKNEGVREHNWFCMQSISKCIHLSKKLPRMDLVATD